MINEYVMMSLTKEKKKKLLWWNYYHDALKYIIELKVIHYSMLQLLYMSKKTMVVAFYFLFLYVIYTSHGIRWYYCTSI